MLKEKEIIKKIMKKDDIYFVNRNKNEKEEVDNIKEKEIFDIKDEKWKKKREVMKKILNKKKMKMML
jgi:hypothetical protein